LIYSCMKPIIAVVGGEKSVSLKSINYAEKIGQDIALNDCILVCGGRGGVMRAACKGARQKNGLTIGILPSLDKKEANEHVVVPLTTGLGNTRNALVVSSADAVIAVDGGVGTLSEISLALCNNKPVVLVENSSGVTDLLLKEKEKPGFEDRIHRASASKAVKKALDLILEGK